MSDEITVSSWRHESGTRWRQVGQIGDYESLEWNPPFRTVTDWNMTLPLDSEFLDILDTTYMITIDFRDYRTTWRIGAPHPHFDEDAEEPILEIAGANALAMLGWAPALPDPTQDLAHQPVLADTDPAPYKGPAETVIKQLVSGNFQQWTGVPILVPTSSGLGKTQVARPKMDNLLELVTNLAQLANLGVAVNLVSPTAASTTADLTLQVWAPSDLTKSITLTAEAGTLEAWDQAEAEPTLTQAIVAGGGTGGMDRVFQVVTTPASVAAANKWGGHRTEMIDGPSSFDPEELQQAGEQAILEGSSTRTLTLTSAEAEGLRGFYHFQPGDEATAEVLSGMSVIDSITQMGVAVDADNGIVISTVFGDPSATDADLDITDQLGDVKRALRHVERKK